MCLACPPVHTLLIHLNSTQCDAICARYLANETRQLGLAVKQSFSVGGIGQLALLENLTVACDAKADPIVLNLPTGSVFDAVVLQEDLRKVNADYHRCAFKQKI